MKASSALTVFIYIVIFAIGAALALFFAPLLGTKIATLNWPDIVSASVAAFAFFLALITYRNWNRQKIKEDAYTTTKSYISTLVSIEETLIGMHRHFNELIPQPGSIALSIEYSKKRILSLKQNHSDLLMLGTKLMHVHDELEFWGASLTNKSDHTKTHEALDLYLHRSDLLINSLVNINFHQIHDSSLISHGSMTHDAMLELFKLFKDRKSKKMSTYFKY